MGLQKKAATLCILKILEKYSDDQHYLNYSDISEYLEKEYGIEIERKSIASAIDSLIDLDYDIDKDGKKGVALLDRVLKPSEVAYLVDAIYSSRIISAKDSKDMAEHISSLLSDYEKKKYRTIYKSEDPKKETNTEFFNSIDVINDAIEENKKITFKYIEYDRKGNLRERRDGMEYKISPYYLINNFGKYYCLSCSDGKTSSSHFRVDYMKDVKTIDEERFPMDNVKDIGPTFNINDYISNHIYMFGGATVNAEILINTPKGVTDCIDWFGKSAKIIYKDGVLKANVKCNEQSLIYWALQYADSCTIIKPESTRNKIYIELKKAYNRYKPYTTLDNAMPNTWYLIDQFMREIASKADTKFTRKLIMNGLKDLISLNSLDCISVTVNENLDIIITNGCDKEIIKLLNFPKTVSAKDYFNILKTIKNLKENEYLFIISKDRNIDKRNSNDFELAFNKESGMIKAGSYYNFENEELEFYEDKKIRFRGIKEELKQVYKYAIIKS